MDTFLLVVCVKEARNIANDVTSASSTLILEARFHDETLASDPIMLPHPLDELTDVSAELAWVLCRKSLHESKIKRVPVKLQVFLYDPKYQEKKLLGYHIFDVRCVQEAHEPKFEWKPLLNSKYKGSLACRPEINCALQVIRDDSNLYSSGPRPENSQPQSKLLSDLQVKETGDTLKIWDANKFTEDQCNEHFLLSIIIATVNNLDQFCTKVSTKDNPSPSYLFHYTLFGKGFRTKYFHSDQPNFPVERISFKIASTGLEDLKTYFDLNPMMEIQLCNCYSNGKKNSSSSNNNNSNSNDQSFIPLAFTSLFLKSLFTSGKCNPIIGEFTLQPADECILDYPNASVGVCIELEHIVTDQSHLGVLTNGSFCKSHSVKSFNGTGDGDDVHHYCFSIDLRSISATKQQILSKQYPYFIRFSYAIFGQVDKIKTSPIELTALNSAVTFKDGYFAFNFASSWNQLATSLFNVPLIFELVQVSSKILVRGLCKLPLTDIIESQADLENKKLIVKKPSILDPREEELALLNCILCLQDLGVVDVESASLATLDLSVLHEHLTSPLTKSHSTEASILEKLFIDAAVEIELWKQTQMQKFTQKLSTKNIDSTVTNGSSNAATLLNDLNDCNYKQVTDILKVKQAEMQAKELELIKANETCKQRYDQLEDEISTAIEEIKAVYEEKLTKERLTIKRLEEQNRKLSDEIVALKSTVKSPSRTSSLVRINSVPSSVRSASKARQSTTKQTTSEQQTTTATNAAANSKTTSVNKIDTRLTKPPIKSTVSTFNTNKKSPAVTPSKTSTSSADRKSIVLQELKNERDTILKKGLCRSDDPMIKTIEKELRRHGVRTK